MLPAKIQFRVVATVEQPLSNRVCTSDYEHFESRGRKRSPGLSHLGLRPSSTETETQFPAPLLIPSEKLQAREAGEIFAGRVRRKNLSAGISSIRRLPKILH